MKLLTNSLKLELVNIVRSRFHLVLLITLAAVVGTYYLLPEGMEITPLFADSAISTVIVVETGEVLSIKTSFLPVMLAFEVAILGFLFIAVTMFNEKEEGIIRAYRVSPAGSLLYTSAKILTWTLIATLYGVFFAAATKRTGFNWGSFLALLLLSNLLMTSLGLLIAVFFRNMSDWFFPGVSVLVINMLPQLALGNSSFNPVWMKIIPGYHMITGFRAILFGGSGTSSMPLLFGGLAVVSILLFASSLTAVHMKLMKEGN